MTARPQASWSPSAGSRDKLLLESLGKTVSVFYNDTANSVSFKVGKFLDFDTFGLKILEEGKTKSTLIPRSKCIRIEIGGEKSLATATTK